MGTHFFSPANVMRLLENVRGAASSERLVASMMAWAKAIGKLPILVGNCPGFVGNRLLYKYSAAAADAVLEGASPAQVDSALEAFGMRMGPFLMADLVGLDLGQQAARKQGAWRPATDLKHALVDAGRLGQKSRAGYYDYADGRTPTASNDVSEIAGRVRAAAGRGGDGASLSAAAIVERVLFPLVNEGFLVLAEGHAQRPSDIDVCYLHGYGFPRHRGGPMHYADAVGLSHVASSLSALGVQPAPLLQACVDAGATLAEYWPRHAAQHRADASKL
eukprot:1200224-Prymnesium_polylepis.1